MVLNLNKMKKRFLQIVTSLAMLSAFSVNAQFLTPTTYVGALSSDIDQDWTAGWTEFNPKFKAYDATTDNSTLNAMDNVASGDTIGRKTIKTDLTLSSSSVYLLKGMIIVSDGATLTIPAGTVIRAESQPSANNYAMILVTTTGKIDVQGTKTSPVVMTSNKAPGDRAPEDWSGVLICGPGRSNRSISPSLPQLEGFDRKPILKNFGRFGGNNETFSNGSIKYLRIEFAGTDLDTDRETNSLTMGAVNNTTTIDYVQVSYGADDGFEWFGGNVNCKHLISYKVTDDDFDTDFGFSGIVQFGIAVRDKGLFDVTYSSSANNGSNTFESDNDGQGTGAKPYTKPIFSNITCVGPIPVGKTYDSLNNTQQSAFRTGALIRRNTKLSIYNSIFMGYKNAIRLESDSVLAYAGVKGTKAVANEIIEVKNNLFVNPYEGITGASTSNGLVEVSLAGDLTNANNFITSSANDNTVGIKNGLFTTADVLTDPNNATAPNYRPKANSPALSGASFDGRLSSITSSEDAIITPVLNSSVYPNPISGGSLTIAESSTAFTLFNAAGKVVRAGVDTQVSVEGLEKGMYFIKLNNKTEKVVIY